MRRDLLRRLSRTLLVGVLALAVLVVGHNIYFLLEYGSDYGSDLARTGDGSNWDATVRVVLASAGLLATAGGLRLAYLFQRVRSTDPGRLVAGLSGRTYLRMVLPIWLRLFSASIPLFVLHENFERWGAGLPLPGIGVFGAIELDSPILVFALVSLPSPWWRPCSAWASSPSKPSSPRREPGLGDELRRASCRGDQTRRSHRHRSSAATSPVAPLPHPFPPRPRDLALQDSLARSRVA